MSTVKTAYILLNQSGGSPLPNGTTGGQYLDSSWPDRWEGGVPSDLAGAQLYGLKIVDGYVERESGGDDFIRVLLRVHQWVDGSLNNGDLITGNEPYYPELPQGTGRVDLPPRNTGTTSLSGPREWDYADGWTPTISLWENDVAGESQRFSYFQFGTGAEPEKALRLWVQTVSYNNNMGGDNDRPWFSPIRIEVKYIPVGPSGPSGSGTPQAEQAQVVGNAFVGSVPDVTASGDLDTTPVTVSGTGKRFLEVTGSGALQADYRLVYRNYFDVSPLKWDFPANQDAPLFNENTANFPNGALLEDAFWQWIRYDFIKGDDAQQFWWVVKTPTQYIDGNVDPDGYEDRQYKTTLRTQVNNYGNTIKFGWLSLYQNTNYLNCYEPDWNYFKFHLKDEAGAILTTFFETGPLWAWALANGAEAATPSTYVAEGITWRAEGARDNPELDYPNGKKTVDFEIPKPDLSLYPTAKWIDWEINVGRRAVTAEKLNGFDYDSPDCNLGIIDPYIREAYKGPVLGYDAGWALGNVADVMGSGQCEASEQTGFLVIDEKDYALHLYVNGSTAWQPDGELLPYVDTFPGIPDYSFADSGWRAFGKRCLFDDRETHFGQKAYKWRWMPDGTGDTENYGPLISDSGVKGEPEHIRSDKEDVSTVERFAFKTIFYVYSRSASGVDDGSRLQVYIDLPVTPTPSDGKLTPGDLITWDTQWDHTLFSYQGFMESLRMTPKSYVIDGYEGNELSQFCNGPARRFARIYNEQFRPADDDYYRPRLNSTYHGRVPEGATWVRIAQEITNNYYNPDDREHQVWFWCEYNFAGNVLDPAWEGDPALGDSPDGLVRRMESPILPASPGDPRMAPINDGGLRANNKQRAITIGAITPITNTPYGMGQAVINPAVGIVADGVLLTTSVLLTGEATLIWFATGSIQATLATVSGSASFILSAVGAVLAGLAKVWSVGSAYRAKKRITQLTKAQSGRATTSGSGTVS